VRVVVAGAGFAGLMAAYRVAQAGHEAVVLEARDRVHFAGEHTAGSWAGLMEGALRSGARAADEVLAHARS
jgi:monoamine oxidase